MNGTDLPVPILAALARLACAERRNGAPCRLCDSTPCRTAVADARAWLDGGMRGRLAYKEQERRG